MNAPQPDEKKIRHMDMDTVGSIVTNAEGKPYGRNNLFKFLRDQQILHSKGDLKNVAKSEYIDRGFFTTTTTMNQRGGINRYFFKTMVTPNGVSFIQTLIDQVEGDTDSNKKSEPAYSVNFTAKQAH